GNCVTSVLRNEVRLTYYRRRYLGDRGISTAGGPSVAARRSLLADKEPPCSPPVAVFSPPLCSSCPGPRSPPAPAMSDPRRRRRRPTGTVRTARTRCPPSRPASP